MERDAARSPGLHLSQILDAREALQATKPRSTLTDFTEDVLENYRTLGFIWEWIISDYLTWAGIDCDRCGELELDGVYLTPDAINLSDWTLEEWKCTWKTSNKDIAAGDFERWLWQTQSYAYAIWKITGNFVPSATIRVFFVRGDYKEFWPQVRFWKIHFTEVGLQENWEANLRMAKSKGWID